MSEVSIARNLEEQFGSGDQDFQIVKPLPPICRAQELVTNPPPIPNELIKGVLHQGSKLVFGGASKSYKTWTLLDMGISVQGGHPWWGHDTVKSKVLYVNFEIQDGFMTERIKNIQETRQIVDVSGLDVWNLRGYAAPLYALLPSLLAPIRKENYGLIIIDPIYKALGGRNESDAGEMGQFCNEVERIAVDTGAAVAFGAHFAKGNASMKESIDRISGSGVFARDPDSILTLTKHMTEGAFVVEMTLRNFQPQEPFCIRWEYPLMVRDLDLNPMDLKKPNGRPKKFQASQLLDTLGTKQLTTSEWKEAITEEYGMPRSTFFELKRELVEEKSVRRVAKSKWERCG